MISTRFVEDVPRLDVADLRGAIPSVEQDASVELEVDIDGVVFSAPLSLTSTAMSRARGRRWWWICPRCGKRRAHLYLSGDVACRQCFTLRHASQYRRSGRMPAPE